MAARKPLVLTAGNQLAELPTGDTLSWGWLSDVPANLVAWAGVSPANKADRGGVGSAHLDTVTEGGMYRFDVPSGGNTNMPISYGQLLVLRGGADTIAQIASDFTSDVLMWRSGNPPVVGGAGTWGPWRELLHTGNHGEASDPHPQYIRRVSGSGIANLTMMAESASTNANYWLSTETGQQKAVIFWNRLDDTLRIGKMDALGARRDVVVTSDGSMILPSALHVPYGAIRISGWLSNPNSAAIFMGANDSYIYNSGSHIEFKVEGKFTAALNTGGTILTSSVLDPTRVVHGGSSTYLSSDANAIPGYRMGPMPHPTANTPSGSWTQILSNHNGDWGHQLAQPWFEDNLYLRSMSAGTWGTWKMFYHSGNFNPATKANIHDPQFTGAPKAVSGQFTVTGWTGSPTQGVIYLGDSGNQYVYGRGTDIEFSSNGWYAQLTTGGTILTTGNFNPISKLDYRPALGPSAGTITDWNTATTNGWYMAESGANAPVGGWLMGTVVVHNPDWITQEVTAFANTTTQPSKWTRHRQAGTWGAWHRTGHIIVSATDPGGMDGTIWVQP